jgi:hypothetical protein
MRHLSVVVIGLLVLAGCGTTTASGECRQGQIVSCTCADGAPGEKACGGAECVCGEDPGCEPGEVLACTCTDGRSGEKVCGEAECVCPEEPECREGEVVPCTCEDGRAGEKMCGAAACTCVEEGCRLAPLPEAGVEFGAVPPGLAAERQLELENLGGGACEVSDLSLVGCGSQFSLGLEGTAETVAPGASLRVPLGFRPTAAGAWACSLSLAVGDPATNQMATFSVPVAGRGDPDCVAVEPGTVAFEPEFEGCGEDATDVAVVNRCDVPLAMDEVALGDGPFLIVAEPPLPAGLAPGSSSLVAVGYRPVEAGSHEGQLRIGLEGLAPRVVPLMGVAEELPWLTDGWEVPMRQVDLLLVIDNGVSMSDNAATVTANLGVAVSSLLAPGDIDLHLAVTTTGLEPGGDCPGGVGGGEDGRFFPVDGSAVRMLTNTTPDLEAEWRKLISVGACRTGPNAVFEAAVRALTPPLADATDDSRHPEANDGNAGFLRPDAHLAVVAITDRDDESPESENYYYNALAAIHGWRNTHQFNFHAIAGDPATGCTGENGAAAPADRLNKLVEKTSGGAFESICDSDWWVFRGFSSAAFAFGSCYHLSEIPADRNGDGDILEADGEIEVRLNDRVLGSRGAQGQKIWSYDRDQNAVCFEPLTVPSPGSTVEVSYRALCS